MGRIRSLSVRGISFPVLGPALALVGITPTAAVADAPDDSVVTFSAPELQNASTKVVRGKKAMRTDVNGQRIPSCIYEVSILLPPGVPALEQHEIAQDTDSCVLTLVEGVPADTEGLEAGQTSAVAAATESGGRVNAWFEEPRVST
jgi:hypothetical protein